MSDNKQTNKKIETVTDILEEMRGMDNYQRYSGDHAHALADRIEAAWKRERAKVEADALSVGGIVEAARTAEKSSAVGNAAAMRDALLNIQEYAAAMDVDDGNVLAILDACRDALSAPARNCDIYTHDEALEVWAAEKENERNGCFDEWLYEQSKKRKEMAMEGNQQKMREVLEEILLICYKAGARYGYDVSCGLIKSKAKKALSAPPRNCDVGTALEQSERFMDFCRPGNRPPNCEECKVYPKRMNKFWCQLEWAQMPYESKEGGAK